MAETRQQKVRRKLKDQRSGKDPQVTAADLLAQVPGEIPLPDERAVLMLSAAIEEARNPGSPVVSWSSQEEAIRYFNDHGLGETLDRIVELGGSLC